MRDWLNAEMSVALSELKIEFLSDYAQLFNIKYSDLCFSCKGNLQKYWFKMQEELSKGEIKKCDFKLKPAFNGVSLGHTGKRLTLSNITNELALLFCKDHPHGVELFMELPENLDELLEGNTTEIKDNELTLQELRVKYPTIKATSKKVFLEKING